jgi:diaminopimelate epimerase
MTLIDFTKSHGLGNDFVIIEDLDGRVDLTPEAVARLCDRHFGIGADGLMIVRGSSVADYFMDFRNADGSVAEMCGNGVRAFAKYIYDRLAPNPSLSIETLAGIKTVRIDVEDEPPIIEVDMGAPTDPLRRSLEVNGRRYEAICLSMGNPHCVVFVEDTDLAAVAVDGAAIESLDIFPEKTNVEFVQAMSRDKLRVRVWERGVGETLACGTGACAALVAANVNGIADRTARIELPGGYLSVDWRENNHLSLAGPVKEVFTGRIELGS